MLNDVAKIFKVELSEFEEVALPKVKQSDESALVAAAVGVAPVNDIEEIFNVEMEGARLAELPQCPIVLLLGER